MRLLTDPAKPLAEAEVSGGRARDLISIARRYRVTLTRYFKRHLGSREDAEDLTQETFVRLTQQRSLVGVINAEAYVLRIASNLLRDRYRRNQSHSVAAHVSLDAAAENPCEGPSPEHVYEQEARMKAFIQSLDELPARSQQVFLLQRFEGLTYDQIAKRLGISVSGVEKHMMNALLHLGARREES